VQKQYRVIGRSDTRRLARWLTKHGFLPLVDLVESTELALEELIDVIGRAAIEAVLESSAIQVACEPHRARRDPLECHPPGRGNKKAAFR